MIFVFPDVSRCKEEITPITINGRLRVLDRQALSCKDMVLSSYQMEESMPSYIRYRFTCCKFEGRCSTQNMSTSMDIDGGEENFNY